MSLAKPLSVYTIASLINAGVPFLLLPLLTSFLSPEEFGILALVQVLIVFVFPFVSMNISSAIQVQYSHLSSRQFATLVSSILIVPVLMAIVVLAILFLFVLIEGSVLDLSPKWILALPVLAFAQVIPKTILSIYQMSNRPVKFAQFQLSLAALNLILSALLIMFFTMGWEGRVIGVGLSYFAFSAIGLLLLLKNSLLVFRVEKEYVIEAFKLGGPLILHVVGAALFMMSDRLFIAYYIGNEALGYYAVGAQVAMIAMIMQQSFNQAWVPYLFSNLKEGSLEGKIKVVKFSYLAFLFFLILPFAIDFLTPTLYSLFINDSFESSMAFVFWIALGYSLLGMYKVVTNYIFYEKRTKLLAALTVFSLCVNLLLNYVLVHKYGAIGVAYATSITVAVFFVLSFFIANKVHKMPWLYFLKKIW